jgi:hypothetical protein
MARLSEAADLGRKTKAGREVLCVRPVKVIEATHPSSRFRQCAGVESGRWGDGEIPRRRRPVLEGEAPEPEGVVRESESLGVCTTGLRSGRVVCGLIAGNPR